MWQHLFHCRRRFEIRRKPRFRILDRGPFGRLLATAARRVRSLLAELQSELELLRQVPELAAKLDDIHRIVTELASRS